MSKKNQVWVITFLDLIMLLVCFFVMVFSIRLTEMRQEKPVSDEDNGTELQLPEQQKITGPLRIIYDNLDAYYKDKANNAAVELMMSQQSVRVLPNIDTQDKIMYHRIIEDLSDHIFNFTKNTIRISLLLNYDNFLEKHLLGEQNFNIEIMRIVNLLRNFSEALSVKSNNQNIETFIDLHSDYPLTKGKDWVIVTDILSEAN